MAKSEGTSVQFATDDLNLLSKIVRDKRQPKSVKEAALRRIRQMERGLEKEVYGDYNGSSGLTPVTYSVSELARQEDEMTGIRY